MANDSGPALDIDGIVVREDLTLADAQVSGAGSHGAIRLTGADVGGQLSCTGATITNNSGPALTAEGLRVDSDLFLRGVNAHGTGDQSVIRLTDARVTGQIDCAGAEITNNSGPALTADGLRVDNDLSLSEVRVRGASPDSAIRLIDIHVTGQIDCAGAEITNNSGPALRAEGLRVDSDLFLNRMRVDSAGEDHAILLISAHISGQLVCTDLSVRNQAGLMVDLGKTQVNGAVVIPADVVCAGKDRSDTDSCPHGSFVGLDGFTFTDLSRMDWRQWLHLIHCHTRSYRPQPYQQLAAVERAAGHDGNARHILITQQHDLRHRVAHAFGGWPTRRIHWFWGALAG